MPGVPAANPCALPSLPPNRLQLAGLEALAGDAGEDEELKRMAREERAALLEEASKPGSSQEGREGAAA